MSKKQADDQTESEGGEGQTKKRFFESKYDPSALRELILSGEDSLTIMSKLKIKHKQTLKQYLLKLINEDQKFYQLPGLYMKDTRRPKINPKGEIKIQLKKLNLLGDDISCGDEFHVSKDDGKIILIKI